MLSEIDKFKKIFVEARQLAVFFKKRLMGPRRAGGHHDPVEVLLCDLFANGRKTVLRTGVKISLGVNRQSDGLIDAFVGAFIVRLGAKESPAITKLSVAFIML